jgi:diguanylate cyclase
MSADLTQCRREPRQPIDRTLAEQMQMTEREISSRKAMLGIGSGDEEVLTRFKPLVVDQEDKIVGRFYEQKLRIPEIALLIGDADTLARLQAAMRRYLLELFERFYDIEYVNKRLRIGKVHKRIGVSPKLYVSAILLLKSAIEEVVAEAGDPEAEAAELEAMPSGKRSARSISAAATAAMNSASSCPAPICSRGGTSPTG